MKEIKLYRQGDLGFVPIKEIPKNAKKIFEGTSFKLADSEVTGNQHILKVKEKQDTKFEVYKTPEGFYILNLFGDAVVEHVDRQGQKIGHKELEFTKCVWFEGKQSEYDEIEELRRVMD